MKPLLIAALVAGLTLVRVSGVHAAWPATYGIPDDPVATDDALSDVKDVVVDRDGNTYILVEFAGEIVFTFADGSADSVRSQGSTDFAVARYDPAGDLVWVTSIGSTEADHANTLALSYDSTGPSRARIHVGGALEGRVNFDGTEIVPVFPEVRLAFVATLEENDEGVPGWTAAQRLIDLDNLTLDREVIAMDTEPGGDGLYVVVNDSVWRLDAANVGEGWLDGPSLPGVPSIDLPDSPLNFGYGDIVQFNDIAFASATRIFVTGRVDDPLVNSLPIAFDGCDVGDGDDHILTEAVDFLLMMEQIESTTDSNDDGIPEENFEFSCVWIQAVTDSETAARPALAANLDGAWLWYDARLRSYDEFGEVVVDETFAGDSELLDTHGHSVAVDDDGNVYVSGTYFDDVDGVIPATPGASPISFPATDVELPWVARRSADGTWPWLQTPDRTGHPTTGETVMSGLMALSPSGGAVHLGGYVEGFADFIEYDADGNVSITNTITSAGSVPLGYVARLGITNGAWITPQAWVLGEEIQRPGPTIRAEFPSITIDGIDDQAVVNSYFAWDPIAEMLYAIGLPPPGLITINWEDQSSTVLNPVLEVRTGVIVPPEDDVLQLYLPGAPVLLGGAHLPGDPGQALRFESVAWPPDAATSAQQDITEGWRFRHEPATSEYAVLRYLHAAGPGDSTGTIGDRQHFYLVTRSVSWNNSLFNFTSRDHPVGSEILPEAGDHDDPSGANGFVVFELSPYDGHGPSRAYNRDTRRGQIFPVNTAGPDDDVLDRLMVVAWYQANDTGVAWPAQTVRYNLSWPTASPAAPPIVVSNLQGSGPLDRDQIGSQVLVYHQPDPELPGFNPNEEHALVVQVPTGVDGEDPDNVVFALRDDLNEVFEDVSPPYTLVKYRNPAGDWVFETFRVCRDSGSALCAPDGITEANLYPTYMLPGGPAKPDDPFVWLAGSIVTPPPPLDVLGPCGESGIKSGGDPNEAGWNDVHGNLWARASNNTDEALYDPGVSGHTVFHFYYPLRSDFYHGAPEDTDYLPTGECVPWLPDAGDVPVDVAYEFAWPDPDTIPILDVGDTLYQPRLFMPNTPQELAYPTFRGQEAAQVIYDEATFNSKGTGPYQVDTPSLVRLLAPTVERKVDLAEFGLARLPDDARTFNRNGRDFFSDLPTLLRSRVSYDPINNDLIFSGSITEPIIGDPQVLPNIMTLEERNLVQSSISGDSDFDAAVLALYHKTRNPNDLSLGGGAPDEAFLVGLDITPPEPDDLDPAGRDIRIGDPNPDPAQPENLVGVPMMLSANLDAGEGYITVALNNDENASAPVELHILQVSGCQAYKGNIWVVPTDNVFEEAITLRHSGLFGGQPDQVTMEWYIQPDSAGQPDVPAGDPSSEGWTLWQNNLNGSNNGLDITIEGANITTLSDNWIVAQYTGSDERICNGSPVPIVDSPSEWAGDPSSYSQSDPAIGKAMLALGWIKRVIAGLNPFDSRVRDFHDNEVSTLSSLIAQAGRPFNGPIPFNPDGDVINSIGLIEAYETILRRGRELSVDAVNPQNGEPAPINDVAANNQLLNVSTRIGDLYMLLCNEAYADAADPTIGFDTGGDLGTLASSIFTFQNQLVSPLEEELNLLRGRDGTRANVGGYPLYNRLPWNFTQGEGEVAYVQSYRITDQNVDGFISEEDAALLFPQGHGDAWGHCLTALKTRYDLLQEADFTWVPRTESVLVGGGVVEVDYLDERKFARAAAARARIGAEVVNLTYRDKYVEDPAGQWQGYKDTAQNADRAWGLDGWARRAGQGAYFDWLTANAILPAEDPDPAHEGIQKIDRTTVEELGQIAAQFAAVQGQLDRADAGLNPIGLAKGVIPFDIDPNFNEVGSGNQGQTHFEQIAERAQQALNNLVAVFDHASQQTNALRTVQDDVDALAGTVGGQERDFKNRLIEIFGYPYADDPDTPSGYDGPDLYKYMYVNSDLTGDLPPPDGSFTGFYSQIPFGDDNAGFYFSNDLADAADNAGEVLEQDFPVATGADWPFIAPSFWGQRRAPGELQLAISDVLQAQAELQRALIEHENLLEEVEDARDLILAEFELQEETIRILETQRDTNIALNVSITAARVAGNAANRTATVIRDVADAAEESIPKSVGLASDAFSAVRGGVAASIIGTANFFETIGDFADITELGLDFAKELRAQNTEIDLVTDTPNVALIERLKELEQLWRQEAGLRVELFTQSEAVQQSMGRYYQLLAEGQRILEERRVFRVAAAAETQQYRYRDATFRIFRNDALQKYRSQFELTARYIYLAAAAYDFETSLASGANGSGRQFLADIVRERVPGQVVDGEPVSGTPGLADVLARLKQNFAVYEGQLGFNNPQIETNRFSMRREWLKLLPENDAAWRDRLAESRVEDLWQIPEFRRYARFPVGQSAGPQPGIVLRFPSTVTFGKNFFDQNLGAGDSAYDASNFATKIRSAGTWFENYATTSLSNTPRIYLFPVLQDVLRTPTNDASITREWSVVDQKLPVPFPVGATSLNDIEWVPSSDSLSDSYGDIRRFSSFRAYHDSGEFDPLEVSSDTRLIGRSVWNNGWVMIIPGGTLLFDADEGLDRFIYGRLRPDAPASCSSNDLAVNPGPEECRDGNGVKDIKLFFQTYGYSGN